MNERETAFRLLQKIEDDDRFAAGLIDGTEGDERSTALVRTLVFGVLRWRSRLDWIIERLAARPLRKLDRNVVDLLRLGVFQLGFTALPAYATVDEMVTLAGRYAPRAKSFVNAILRRASERDLGAMAPEGNDVVSIAARHGHPEWLVDRWVAQYGATRTAAIAAADQHLSHPDLLVNRRRLSVEEGEAMLAAHDIRSERSPLAPEVLRLNGASSRVAAEIEAGLFYPMDEGSVVVAGLVSGERVLDAAAAPGGKSLALLAQGHRVVSHDLSLRRLQLLRGSAPRMFGAEPWIVAGDATRLPFRRGSFDAVLLDAPCSATGTFRKNPEAKWRITAASIAALCPLQEALLESALELEPRECIYSTCSLEAEENDRVVEKVLASRPEYEKFDLAERAPQSLRGWIAEGVLRLTPDSGADGFTVHGLRRKRAS